MTKQPWCEQLNTKLTASGQLHARLRVRETLNQTNSSPDRRQCARFPPRPGPDSLQDHRQPTNKFHALVDEERHRMDSDCSESRASLFIRWIDNLKPGYLHPRHVVGRAALWRKCTCILKPMICGDGNTSKGVQQLEASLKNFDSLLSPPRRAHPLYNTTSLHQFFTSKSCNQQKSWPIIDPHFPDAVFR